MRAQNSRFLRNQWVTAAAGMIVAVFGLIFIYRSAFADVAPPKAPPGSNPEVETVETKVRMMEEKVVIDVQQVEDIKVMGTARVWAEFQMKNLGSESEQLMVRFPSSFSDGFRGYPEIEDMIVTVNDVSVQPSRVELEGEPENWADPVQWVEFEVSFPPAEIVEIEVEYTLKGTGEYPFVTYDYLLETGAGWKGTIGSAEIIVRLPYQATNKSVFVDNSPGWGRTTAGAILTGNEVQWYFEDFEPAYEHNIGIAIVWPSAMAAVEREEKNVRDFPEDGEAWGRLGKLYKEISRLRRGTRTDPGGEILFKLSQDAYQNALKYLPDDALWHLGYADLLVHNAYFSPASAGWVRDDFVKALQEMHTAYHLAPDQADILRFLNSMFPPDAVGQEGEEYIFYWLTQTPTLEIVSTTEQVLEATQPLPGTTTPEPTDLPSTPTPTSPALSQEEKSIEDEEDVSALPVCGSGSLFPLMIGLILGLPGLLSIKKPRISSAGGKDQQPDRSQ